MLSRKKLKRAGEYWLARFLILLARLPGRPGRWLFAGLVEMASWYYRVDRNRSIENLAMAFPESNDMIQRAMSRAMFRSLGRNAYEFLSLSWARPGEIDRRIERVEGLEWISATLKLGRGMIVVTGHIGCWELLSAYFAAQGYRISAVARRMKVSRVNEQLISLRSSLGVRTLDRQSSPREMLSVLGRGEVLGVLIDQHTRVAGVYVPFFGRPAHTPTTVAKIAIRSGAPILPMAIYLQRGGRHLIRVLEPIMPPERSGDRRLAIFEVTAKCSDAIEQLVRFDPKQWVWFHDRWREREEQDVA